MSDALKPRSEMSLTKAEYDRLMADRNRPLFEPYLRNDQAGRWRAEQSLVAPSATGEQADVIVALIADRTARRTADTVIGVSPPRSSTPRLTVAEGRPSRASLCGSEEGFAEHRHQDSTPCGPCVAAHTVFVRTWLAS